MKRVGIAAAVRTPWTRRGGVLSGVGAHELATTAVREALLVAGLRGAEVDALVLGVARPSQAAGDLARIVGLGADLAAPAVAVSVGSISGERALAVGADMVALGRARVVVLVGVETPSDVRVGFSRSLRRAIAAARRADSLRETLHALAKLRPADLELSVPRSIEPATGEPLVAGAELLARRFHIERVEQDRYAARSHARAVAAWRRGLSGGRIVPVPFEGALGIEVLDRDEGPGELDPHALAARPPLLSAEPGGVDPLATVTEGNAAPEADGAAAIVLVDPDAYARPLLGTIAGWRFAAVDPHTRPLLGAVPAVLRVLADVGVSTGDVHVVEIHEAFAVSLLATVQSIPGLDMGAVNRNGGSIAFGHPAGATGLRLVASALERLGDEDGRHALTASSAAAGQGAAIVLERA